MPYPFRDSEITTDEETAQIKIWGRARPGQTVTVRLGEEAAEAKVQPEAPVEGFGLAEDYAGLSRWEVTFPAREASADPITLVVTAGDEKVMLKDIFIGDVWGMSMSSTNHTLPGAGFLCRHAPCARFRMITGCREWFSNR